MYDPTIRYWFRLFEQSTPRWGAILRHARTGTDGLAHTLSTINSAFHDGVDSLLIDATGALTYLPGFDHLRPHVTGVEWAGHPPPTDADDDEIHRFLVYKIKRNISLGFLEAVAVLNSAIRALEMEALFDVATPEWKAASLRDSYPPLIGLLSVLEDYTESEFLAQLFGHEERLTYPETDFDRALGDRFTIPPSRFRVVADSERFTIGYTLTPPTDGARRDPVPVRCPAHRLRDADGVRYNQRVWNLLIAAFQAHGRLAARQEAG